MSGEFQLQRTGNLPGNVNGWFLCVQWRTQCTNFFRATIYHELKSCFVKNMRTVGFW